MTALPTMMLSLAAKFRAMVEKHMSTNLPPDTQHRSTRGVSSHEFEPCEPAATQRTTKEIADRRVAKTIHLYTFSR
jgi:hypothetical protein